MGQTFKIEPKPKPTGTQTIRLRDVPFSVRRRAYYQLIRHDALSDDEAQNLLALIVDPGDKGSRIAA
jgi:hypothetical protein